jgi:sigma-B regulation protein RsbU (phosphoserine phosphatase)
VTQSLPDSDAAEDLFEHAPCGYVTTTMDGTLTRVNATFAAMVGRSAAELTAGTRFQDLLTVGGRIYHETHYRPLLRLQGHVREVAVELRGPGGTPVPALISSTTHVDAAGEPQSIRTIVLEATSRRRYEEELRRERDREHAVAQRLQASLLAGDLPADARLELGLTYLPADDRLDVGGDWYDAFLLDEERLALVVGDVVGRGLEAAATMGQLRSAVRALASTVLGPGALLEALDRYAARHGVGQMATVAYVELDLGTGRLCVACAGHPPPVVVAPGGVASLVWDGRSAPLDAHLEAVARPQTEVALAAGGAVLLYTDGLIERGDRPLTAGLDALLEESGAHAGQPAQQVADELPVQLLSGRRTRDDVCLLVAGWTAPSQSGAWDQGERVTLRA